MPAVAAERVVRAVLLEGIGPLAEPADRAPQSLAEALAQEARLSGQEARVFPSIEAAVEARRRDSDLDPASARLLVERGTEAVEGGVRLHP